LNRFVIEIDHPQAGFDGALTAKSINYFIVFCWHDNGNDIHIHNVPAIRTFFTFNGLDYTD